MSGRVGDRVRADLEAGRLWKARDRLEGALRADPTNQRVLDQLGEVYFEMGDLPQAGRLWYLSGRTGPDWDKAESAFYERYGRKPANLVAALRVRGTLESYPGPVQDRLRGLQARLLDEGLVWEPREGGLTEPRHRTRAANIIAGVAFILFLIVVLVGLINGIATIVSAVGSLFSGR